MRVSFLRPLFALLMLAASCAVTGTPAPSSTPQPSASPLVAAFPATVTDFQNRPVTVPRRPERIVSIGPSITEFLFALGAGPRLVGVDDFSDEPAAAAQVEPGESEVLDHTRGAGDAPRGDVLLRPIVRPVERPLANPGEIQDRFAHGLARDGAQVQRTATDHVSAVDDHHLLAELGRGNRALLPGGTTADDGQIVMRDGHGLGYTDQGPLWRGDWVTGRTNFASLLDGRLHVEEYTRGNRLPTFIHTYGVHAPAAVERRESEVDRSRQPASPTGGR